MILWASTFNKLFGRSVFVAKPAEMLPLPSSYVKIIFFLPLTKENNLFSFKDIL